MQSEKNEILELNQYMKSDKMPNIIYAEIGSLIKKIDGCINNPENSSTTKIEGHIPCRYSISTIWAFDHIENKHNLHPGKKRLYENVLSIFKRKHAKNLIDFEKKNMLPLTKKN